MRNVSLQANYYQQFDADLTLEVPGEGYGGWQRGEIEISLDRTALVLMHAWDTGLPEEYPGWYRCVEYLPRAASIVREVFPPLLQATRAAQMPVLHVVGGGNYYQHLPGYQRAVELAGEREPAPEQITVDSTLQQLQAFRSRNVFVGEHNQPDVGRGFLNVDFPEEARPHDGEGVAENVQQLFALCKDAGINHLIYAGFAINWCLLLSPGGMADMTKHGIMCSALRQAVTAVENKETARQQLNKEAGLWRVALAFGFVFDVPDFTTAIQMR